MATTPADNAPPPKPQRIYQALCPSCGAPVRFLSAASTHAVCGYCQSTVAREGDALQKIGTQAELFDDHSPLQLFATGQWSPDAPTADAAAGGAPAGAGAKANTFTLVGRLQYRYGQGTWNEWLAWFDDGRTAYLSEDNGSYVMSQPLQGALLAVMQQALGPLAQLRTGQSTTLQGTPYSVTSVQQATLIAAQGEFPSAPPPAGHSFAVVELRSPTGTVLSAEGSSEPPGLYLGRAVDLGALRLKGLRDEAAQKDVQGRSFACPNCGSPVQPVLAETKSITCKSCDSLIDLSQGIGGELRHAAQDRPITPTIALGATGTLQGKSWQVVGFQHRVGKEPGDDELFGWSEYLLYNRNAGFQFLVESSEGWSLVRPITGAPEKSGLGSGMRYNGRSYTLQYQYSAETDYVAGEFYWQVKQGETTRNADYANGQYLLSREEGRSSTGSEVVWSSGSRLQLDVVARAFGLKGPSGIRPASARDAALPAFAAVSLSSFWWVLFWIILILVLFAMLRSCDDAGSGYGGSGGGGYGGYSSGGGHK